jgi:hypothetical protein
LYWSFFVRGILITICGPLGRGLFAVRHVYFFVVLEALGGEVIFFSILVIRLNKSVSLSVLVV